MGNLALRKNTAGVVSSKKNAWSCELAHVLNYGNQFECMHSSAQLLWTTLCARILTLGKTIDFKGKNVPAQKQGRWTNQRQNDVFTGCFIASVGRNGSIRQAIAAHEDDFVRSIDLSTVLHIFCG